MYSHGGKRPPVSGVGAAARVLLPAAVIAFVSLTLAAPAGALDTTADLTQLSIEELMDVEVGFIVSASRYIQKVQEAPASVTVIGSEEIQRYGYRNLDDVLKSVIGFRITNDRTYSYNGFRGFGLPGDYNARILLLIDGHRINQHLDGSYFSDWGLGLDLGMVSRIEVVRGPGSALYGSNAMLAIINVVTRSPKEESGLEAGLIMGEPGLTVPSVRYLGETGSIRYSLNLQRVWRKGHEILYFPEFADPGFVDLDGDGNAEYSGYTRNSDGEESVSLRAHLEMGGLEVTGFFTDWEKTIPTGSYLTLFDTGLEKTKEGSYYLDLRYRGSLGEKLTWEVGGTLDSYWYEGDYPYAYDYFYPNNDSWLTPPYTIFKDDQSTSWRGVEVGADFTGLPSHRILAGARYEVVDVDLRSYDVDPSFIYEDDQFSFFGVSAYLQDEISLSRSLKLVAGFNQSIYDEDIYRGDVSRINPRVALMVQPGPSTTVKLLYGEAFRAPSMFELIYDDGGDTQIANPDLMAEILKTGEVAFWHEFSEKWGVRASVYRTVFENLISAVQYDPVGNPDLIQYQNAAEDVLSQGLEIEVRKYLADHLSGYLSAALQKTEQRETGEELPNSPREMVNAGVSIPFSGKEVFLSLDAHYVGEAKLKDLSGSADPYILTNVTLSHNGLAEGLELSFSVRNLFDENYSHPASFDNAQDTIRQDPREMGFNLTYRF